MALQLHRFFVPRLSVMSHCRGLQNYPGICLPFSPFRSGTKLYGEYSQIKFRKARETCRMSIKYLRALRCMVEPDSCFFRSTYDGYLNLGSATFKVQLHVSVPYPMQCNSFVSSSCVESRVNVNVFTRRFFSVKSTRKSQTQRNSMNMNDKVIASGGKSGGNFKRFNKFGKYRKSTAVRSSNSDGSSQVAISTHPVKKTVSDTSKPVSKSTNGLKLKEKSSGRGEKDKKTESTVSSVAKSDSNPQDTKAEGKKTPQRKKKLVKPSVSTASSGKPKADVSEQASRGKEATVSKHKQSPQASEILPTDETPLPMKKFSLTKKKPGPKKRTSIEKKQPQKLKGDTKPKASAKHNSTAVVVEVNKRSQAKALKPLYPPTGKSVVVVESLTKAKVIQGYLGDMFEVLPSYGHVRDLAGRSGSVRPDDDFSVVWEVPAAAWTHLKSIKIALNGAKNLILASDPDREGEAIAWHIMEMLQQQEALHENLTVARVVFHEITEQSIKSALQLPRDIDANLVHAYLARRALDYLIGFSISPLLWRKLPACQSAGRVQSAALALICDKEMEIDEFKPQDYWTVDVDFKKKNTESLSEVISVPSHLTNYDFKRLEQLSISSEGQAKDIEQRITSSSFEVVGTKQSKARKNPPPPYITSTLQQDAANKLHFSTATTMKLAQKLYEGVKLSNDEATGLITYMRTDGLHVSDDAAKDIRSLVIQRYGNDSASEHTRKYFKKVKNAQEAHEAIRPTNIRRLPSMLTEVLDEDCLKLYTLIWSRAMACQMEPSVIDQIQVDIGGAGKSLVFRSTSSRVEFLGYQAVFKDLEVAAIGYNEKERDSDDKVFKLLSTLKLGDPMQLGEVELKQHSTQPPSRYSEGSLVKKLEELGIGRPSTYASTIKVLKDRNYVTTKSRVLHPEFRGRMVSAFLSHHFSEVTDYSFTADMETELDNVSAGTTEWKGLLKDYWTRFSMYCVDAANVDVRQVEKMLEETFGHLLFAPLAGKSRICPSCLAGTLIFKVSRFGSGYFIGCDQHPKCKYIAKTMYGDDEDDETPQRTQLFAEPKVLGIHSVSDEKVLLKNGPYGFYVQLGEDRKGFFPKRASVSHIKDVEAITLDDALDLLRYPILLGNHPEDDLAVYLRLAKHGLAIKHRRTIAPVPKNTDPKDITLEKALTFLLSKDAKRCGRPKNKPKQEEEFEVM